MNAFYYRTECKNFGVPGCTGCFGCTVYDLRDGTEMNFTGDGNLDGAGVKEPDRDEYAEAKQMAADHWEYSKEILAAAGVGPNTLELCGILYTRSYVHGAKHEREDG